MFNQTWPDWRRKPEKLFSPVSSLPWARRQTCIWERPDHADVTKQIYPSPTLKTMLHMGVSGCSSGVLASGVNKTTPKIDPLHPWPVEEGTMRPSRHWGDFSSVAALGYISALSSILCKLDVYFQPQRLTQKIFHQELSSPYLVLALWLFLPPTVVIWLQASLFKK